MTTSPANLEAIEAAKFRVLQAESRLQQANKAVTSAEVDLRVAQMLLDNLRAATAASDPATDGKPSSPS